MVSASYQKSISFTFFPASPLFFLRHCFLCSSEAELRLMTKWMDETMYWKQLHIITSATGTPTTGIFTIPICTSTCILFVLFCQLRRIYPGHPALLSSYYLIQSQNDLSLFGAFSYLPLYFHIKLQHQDLLYCEKAKALVTRIALLPLKITSLDCTLRKQSTLACPSDLHHLPRSFLLLLTNRCCVVCRGLLATELKVVTGSTLRSTCVSGFPEPVVFLNPVGVQHVT